MSISKISGVKISGIASAVPQQVKTLLDDAGTLNEEDIYKISKNTGVKQRYIVPSHICTSDLCCAAAKKMFIDTKIDQKSVDALIFVSQTPDYILPATSCIIQQRLELSKECASFDVNMGCSGYIYGLWIASNLISTGGAERVLLLVGDTSSKLISNQDRSVQFLFGDAGTATLIEKSSDKQTMTFVMGTDGAGAKNLIVSGGGFRNPSNEETRIRREHNDGTIRTDEELYMNGAEIFSFTIDVVPKIIKSLLKESSSDISDIDFFVFHQANKFILNFIAKKMQLPDRKVPIIIDKFGNTSSSSIPLTLSISLSENLSKKNLNLVLSGFGVGYSWGAVKLNIGPVCVSDLTMVV
jgi:3-oxoacyl-[acyl-carrier-protein] synthase-3